MKILLILLFYLVSVFPNSNESKGNLIVHIDGIKEVKGNVGILVFNEGEGFPEAHANAILNLEVAVTSSEMKIDLGELPYGKYAIALLHDVNANKVMDKNLLGIPKEPFGFSMNKSILFGLPDFNEAAVSLSQAKRETVIKLISFN